MVGAAIGGVAGIFFWILGTLIGPLFGAIIGELSLQRNFD